MKIYDVGGSVRDVLMGLVPQDYDKVVVGSTPEEMLSLGFKQVGANFPVFLHPETGDEFALARTESSTGEKYQDFDCYFGKDVTIEKDLERRDLTVNSIAKDIETGELIDPYGGVLDIKNKVLRHTSSAFIEDPLRVLRLARFLARFGSEWTVAEETRELCDSMWKSGMLESLTPERVWLETEKALKSEQPSLYFTFLSDYYCLFPMVKDMMYVCEDNPYHPEQNLWLHTAMVMDYAAKEWSDPEITLSAFLHDAGKKECYKERNNGHGHEEAGLPHIEAFCEKWKVPNNYRDLALMVCKYHQKVHSIMGRNTNDWTKPKTIMNLFQETNALAKPERFIKMLLACEADARGRGHTDEEKEYFLTKDYLQPVYLLECLNAAISINTKEISTKLLTEGKQGTMIGEAIRVARIDVIRKVQNTGKNKEKAIEG